MPVLTQRSFAGGVVAPVLNALADQTKYQQGLARCRNAFVLRYGAAANRHGLEYVRRAKDNDAPCQLVPFIFNDEQTYVLEVGAGYIRFYFQGARLSVGVLDAWAAATEYEQGDLVENGGTNYYCKFPHDAAALNEPGVGPDAGGFWHALTADIFEVPTDYTTDEVRGLNGERRLDWVQSNDVLILTQNRHAPHTLSRLGNLKWVWKPIEFQPSIERPASCAADGPNPSGSGKIVRYKVTAIEAETLKESSPAPGDLIATGIDVDYDGDGTGPVEIGTIGTPHGLEDGDVVVIASPAILIDAQQLLSNALGDGEYAITVTGAETFTLNGTEDLGIGPAIFNASLHRPYAEDTVKAIGDGNDKIDVSWESVNGATEYWIYKDDTESGKFGFIGSATGTSFADPYETPNYEETPPIWRNPFRVAGDFPAVAGFYQQRLVLASTINSPAGIWLSRSGDFYNFTTRSPLQDDDSISLTLAGREAQQIRGMIDLGQRFIVLTDNGEWVMSGNGDGVLTPSTVNVRQDGYNGSSTTRLLVANRTALYVQSRGNLVFDLRYQLEADSYVGQDLTTFAPHLVDNLEIVDWAFAQVPDSVVYVVRSDGVMIALTYVLEQGIWGWSEHDTRGTIDAGFEGPIDAIESVAVVPEGRVDTLYVSVRRTIGAQVRRYIERLAPRRTGAQDYDLRTDARFVDSHLTYDGTNTTADTITPTEFSGGGWAIGATITLTKTNAESAPFDVLDVDEGRGYRLFSLDEQGLAVEFEMHVAEFVSATQVRGTIVAARAQGELVDIVDSSMHGVATADWVRMVREVNGADHLNTENVFVIGDGVVYRDKKVSSGKATLPEGEPRGIIHVGLPIYCELELLDIAVAGGDIADRVKHVPWAELYVEQARGLVAGPDGDNLQPANHELTDPIELASGRQRMQLPTNPDRMGRVVVAQPEPWPFTLLAVTRGLQLGDR